MADLDAVRSMAHALIAQHLDEQWTFAFDNAKRRAGLTNHARHRISISRYLAAKYSDDDVRQILLHEVAHGLAGFAAAHGPEWRRIAHGLGYRGGRLHDGEIASELAPWQGRCPAGHEHHRFRKPTRPMSCAKCSRRFDAAHTIRWTHVD